MSFDGTPEVQDRQRPTSSGRGSSKKVSDTLRALDSAGLSYGIRMTVTGSSVDKLQDGIDYICTNFRPKKIQVEPVFPEGRAGKEGAGIPDTETFIQQFIGAYLKAKTHGIDVFYSGARPEIITRRFCMAVCRALVVTVDGDVTTCFETFGREHPQGAAFIVGGFKNGEFDIDHEKLRRLFSHSVDMIPLCSHCFCRWHCAGDCAVKRGASGFDDIGRYSERCRITRELTKFLIFDEMRKKGGILLEGHRIMQ